MVKRLSRGSVSQSPLFLNLLLFLALTLSVAPTVNAYSFQDFLESLGLASYYSGDTLKIPSDYPFKAEYTATLSRYGECEGIASSSTQYKKFTVYYKGKYEFHGVVAPSGSHRYCAPNRDENFPITVKIQTYEKTVAGTTSHSTKVYKLNYNTNTYDYWHLSTKDYNSDYWCSDSSKNAYVGTASNSNKVQCLSSAPSVSVNNGAKCQQMGGVQFKNCEANEEYGLKYERLFNLDDGSGMQCCKPTFTNYYGGCSYTNPAGCEGGVFPNDSVGEGLGYLAGGVIGGVTDFVSDVVSDVASGLLDSVMDSDSAKAVKNFLFYFLIVVVVLLLIFLGYRIAKLFGV